MENNEANQQNNQPSIIALLNSDDEIQIQFADGLKLIPTEIVQDLGAEYFEQRSEAFKKINYQIFWENYQKTVQKRQLNQYQADFIAGHFG